MLKPTGFVLPVKLYRKDLINLDLLMLKHFDLDKETNILYTSPVPLEWQKEVIPLSRKSSRNRKLIPEMPKSKTTRDDIYVFIQKQPSESDSVRELCIELQHPKGYFRLILNNRRLLVDCEDAPEFEELRTKVIKFVKKRRPIQMYTPVIIAFTCAVICLIGLIAVAARVKEQTFAAIEWIFNVFPAVASVLLLLFELGVLYSKEIIFLNHQQESDEKLRYKERREFYSKAVPIVISILSLIVAISGLLISSMK